MIYLALFAYGMVIDMNSDANFVPFNNADNWLHLGLGAGMVVLGLALATDAMRDDDPAVPSRAHQRTQGRPRSV